MLAGWMGRLASRLQPPVEAIGEHVPTTWIRMTKLADDRLPRPLILHPWPDQRFAVKYPRWEPDAGKPHARFCAGGAQ
jgi:hypothetical protein